MFTLGAVGIARVAIEKDRAYSLGYAGILGIAAFLSMLKFVDSPIFSAVILVVIAYLSDRIVRDCTLIDEDVDASGQGLIDSGRLFVRQQVSATEDSDLSKSTEDSGATRRNKTHQPGRTVMYLALAALPLFGLGQFFLRDDPTTWERAQKLLAFYLFASLSLLVTTSFLGLRRYLRQRKVSMPSDVSIAWLAGGLALVALILFIAFMAPVPGQLLASIELPKFLDSPSDTVASKQGWGEDAADKKSEDAATTSQDKNAGEKEVQEIAPGQNAPAGDVGSGKKDEGPAGSEKGGDKPAADKSSEPGESKEKSQDPSDKGKSEEGKSGDKPKPADKSEAQSDRSDQPSDESSKNSPDQKSETPGEKSDPKSEQNTEPNPDPSNERSPNEKQPDPKKPTETQQPSSTPKSSASSSPSPVESIANSMPGISELLKLLIFAGLAAIVAAFIYIHRHAIGLWWSQLLNRSASPAEGSFDDFLEAETSVPPRSFASFTNPIGRESDPRRVIVITFAAWEAWCREHGIARSRQETPSEFLSRTSTVSNNSSKPASRIVDAYNRIVYGRGMPGDQDITAAGELWKSMLSR